MSYTVLPMQSPHTATTSPCTGTQGFSYLSHQSTALQATVHMWSSWARTSRTPLTQDVDTTVTGTQAEMCCLRTLQLLPAGMRSQPAADGHRRKNTYIHSLQEKHTRREPGGLSVKGPMSPARWKGVSMGQMRMDVTAGGQVHLLPPRCIPWP